LGAFPSSDAVATHARPPGLITSSRSFGEPTGACEVGKAISQTLGTCAAGLFQINFDSAELTRHCPRTDPRLTATCR
jgi:hypothetical protein